MYFLIFLDWVKSCGSVKLRFQAKTKVSQTCVGFVKKCKVVPKVVKTKVARYPKSKNSRITKTIKLAILLIIVLSVKRVLTLVPLVLMFTLLY